MSAESPTVAEVIASNGAYISGDGLYRYRLWRRWEDDGRTMVWIMLNPSTADAETDDPTIRRCISFAKREGCNAIEVINLYALRCTKPKHLLDHPDPEGEDNGRVWWQTLNISGMPLIVAAWGASVPKLAPPSQALLRFKDFSDEWLCLGQTADGSPRHPLYIPADTRLEPLA